MGTDHAMARAESTNVDATNWRLQQSGGSPNYNVGELEEFKLEMHIETLFCALNPGYLSLNPQEAMV